MSNRPHPLPLRRILADLSMSSSVCGLIKKQWKQAATVIAILVVVWRTRAG